MAYFSKCPYTKCFFRFEKKNVIGLMFHKQWLIVVFKIVTFWLISCWLGLSINTPREKKTQGEVFDITFR